jgi:hypothetical protein
MAAVAAAVCLAIGNWLAWHHPLAPTLAIALLILWTTVVFLRPIAWLYLVPALLPIIDLAPWTGWLIGEEFDILVLGAAAGAYASMAIAAPQPHSVQASRFHAWLIGLVGVSVAIGLWRGLVAAGSIDIGWFDGYYDAANSLRIAKSYLLALLMLPPLMVEMRRSDRHAFTAMTGGLAAGLGLASLAVLWERLAFPGLLNFSSDYRTTALFWEMHVGGAALDGFLALAFPFAIAELMSASNRVRWVLAGAVVLLTGYACLTTFSRGVYLALPVSLLILALMLARRGNSWSLPMATKVLGNGLLWALVMAAMSWLVFRSGGYRALLALLGVFAMTLPSSTAARGLPVSGWFAAVGSGVLAGVAGSVVAVLVPKGVYIQFGLAFACCTALLALRFRQRQHTRDVRSRIAGLAAYVWLVIAAAGVALGWGGMPALRDIALALAMLAVAMLWNARAGVPLWPDNLRMQGVIAGVAALAAVTTAVFSGGAYMAERFASSEHDAAGRLQHWRDGVGMLKTPADWLLGMGAGRFPQNYLFASFDREFPGSSRIESRDGEHYVVLSGPRHEEGFGEVFRVGQWVGVAPAGHYSVILDARAPNPARLHIELCERHLLYVEGCAIALLTIPATDGSWHRYVAQLDGAQLGAGPRYTPRLAFFALAADSPQTRIEFGNVSLLGPDGAAKLANGDFLQGMSRWFTTSDRYHLPWHIKNLGLAVLFDSGIAGLLLQVALAGCALYRLAGPARSHPMAPFLAAALAGFMVVGLFDSLLDVPRLAFLFYLLILASLMLPISASADLSAAKTTTGTL